MSSKATHKGTCQICGKLYKLPGGVLANHGYKIVDGSFSVSCTGSGHEPYETSKSALDREIQHVSQDAEKIEKSIKDAQWTHPTEVVGWHLCKITKLSDAKRWLKGTYVNKEDENTIVFRPEGDGWPIKEHLVKEGSSDIAEAIDTDIKRFLHHEKRRLLNTKFYIERQQNRANLWGHRPEALVPVKNN